MQKSLLIASLALATTLAACSSNGTNSLPTSGFGAPKSQITFAPNTLASAVDNTTAAIAKAFTTPAATNTAAAATQGLTLAQVATANRLTPAQTAQIQNLIQQGTVLDQKNGLTAQQQTDNTQKRLLVYSLLYGQSPTAATGH